MKSVIDSTENTVPFSLENKEGTSRISVSDPLWAEDLTYSRIHQKFEPVSSSISDNLFSLASGEKVKGYEKSEDMLKEGTLLTGLGKIQLNDGRLTLSSPAGSMKYILSTSSLKSIISSQTSGAKFLKGLAIFFAIGSSLCLTYWLYRKLKNWNQARQHHKEFNRLLSDNEPSSDKEHGCIICLTNSRNVVLLNCGHICVCHDCSKQLTSCPICRSQIEKVVPVFIST